MGVVVSRISPCSVALVSLVLIGGAAPAGADPLILSTEAPSVIDEEPFESGDLFAVDETPGSASLFLSHTVFTGPVDVDAAAHQPDGTVILSTSAPSQIGAEIFEDGDLVLYDPVTGGATLWLDDDTEFSTDVDIDAVHVLDDGRILFSVRNDTTLFPGMAQEAFYLDGDVIEYDPQAGVSSLHLSESIFTWNVDENGDEVPDFADPDVDGVSMLPNGHLLLSIRSAARIGEDVFSDGEIIEYDTETGAASLHLSLFERSATNIDVNAVTVHLPEPGAGLLLGAALCVVGILRGRSSR